MPPATKRNKPAKSDGVKKAVPRVPRACDNCRLRKSKCDGLLPCSFCQQHDSECTYDESRPKKQLDTKYIVSLERTVERFKDILGIPSDVEVTPEVLDEYDISRLGQLSRQNSSLHSVHHVATQTSPPGTPQGESPVACTLLESMVEATGRLNIDEDGNYDYSGSNSGLLLVERIRQRCDQLLNRRYGSGPNAAQERRSPAGTSSRLLHRPSSRPRSLTALPSWDIAVLYTNAVFSEAFSLFNFIHRPSFESRLQLYYSARNAGLEPTLEDTRFEALLNAMFALGELFNAAGDSSQAGSAAREARSEQFFAAAQQSLDLTDCRDTLSLQALLCSIIYLQGSGQIPSCYTYLSLAMTAAVRMGMHRADSLSKFDPLEREVRKRIFWTIRAMDSYITTVLDLPRTLRDDDTDQAYPVELDDDAITPQNIGQPTASSISLMSSVNAHTKLSLVLVKAKNITSGGNDGEHKLNNRYQVDYAKIVEAEKDLIEWTSHLPSYNKLPEPVPKDIEREVEPLHVRRTFG
ncbi:uncharacterized protein PV09_00718 [Verruconis gallopava]|uniref:Zn(2)-C6 fungal-type domain-containing protein n=1 Tax=Verruconis gallopava TaxID=253628 RepID=A0A0D2AQ09_9PEZI|nr:uncharacterized protein PV09_00718 [Verruconis gallopava]KIW08783.1 hypothetical protein PV09_00718 [Verruconis gallopava]